MSRILYGWWGIVPSSPTLLVASSAHTFLSKPMDKRKSSNHYTEVHFHAPVGQYIDYIENQTVTFDKDMNMQVANVGNSKPSKETTAPQGTIPKPISLPFFVPDKLIELGTYTVDEFETIYHKAVKEGAPVLAPFLKHYGELSVFHFKGYNKKQIYESLKAFFGDEMAFGYPNFVAYY